MRRSTYIIRFLSGAIVIIWVAWILLLLTEAGSGSIYHNDTEGASAYFSRLGTFGDAFGVIGSLMATLAAMGAFYTFSEQREESRRNQFEQNFNTLLANFQSIARQIDVAFMTYELPDDDIPEAYWEDYAKELYKVQGRDALRKLLAILRKKISPDDFLDSKVVARAYDEFYDEWMDDLGHYFRCLYHLVRSISIYCPRDKLYYSRIVRAHLSNSEQILLAYNCVFGEGRFEFVKYLKEFSLLHNLHRRNLAELPRAEFNFFLTALPSECFRFDAEIPFTYDSIPPRHR